jgi:dihydroorotase
MSTLIQKGHVIDPANKIDGTFDILIENGKIARIAKDIKTKPRHTINAKNRIVVPGLIDMHTHLREPGREDKETIQTGLRAAIKGGFTSVCSMPNTTPPCDNQSIARFIIERAKAVNLAHVFPIGTITKNREGKELSEMGDLREAGCVAFSDDGNSMSDASLMRRALEYASMLNIPVISHCEDKAMSQDGVMHEGFVSTTLGLRATPSSSESTVVERDIAIAEMTGSRLHIAHVSAKESVDAIAVAKKKGVKVTAEVTPHHLALTDMCVKTFDTNTKVNPPLRTKEDQAALKRALKENVIDVIATDHAPHLESEKDVEFDHAPFGIVGLETALSLSIMELVDTKLLGWGDVVEKLSLNPSKILGLNKGMLSEGSVADITIIDPHAEWVYRKEDTESKSFNSPFIGWTLRGFATDVIVGGRIVMRDRVIM